MSLHGNDVCLLEVEDYNLYEEEASNHAFARYGSPAWSPSYCIFRFSVIIRVGLITI